MTEPELKKIVQASVEEMTLAINAIRGALHQMPEETANVRSLRIETETVANEVHWLGWWNGKLNASL